jgi:catechol 2,3-dioxygenase-like lactoylglutathione lyase family enzyme
VAKPEHGPRVDAEYLDHVGLVVTDLDGAVDFFTEVFGATELFRSSRPRMPNHFMSETFRVHDHASFELSMVRLASNANLELFEWSSPDQKGPHLLSDIGAAHIAMHVSDIDDTATRLRESGKATQLGEVKTVPNGSPVAGNRWCYFSTQFGVMIELVNRPIVEPYEGSTPRPMYKERPSLSM